MSWEYLSAAWRRPDRPRRCRERHPCRADIDRPWPRSAAKTGLGVPSDCCIPAAVPGARAAGADCSRSPERASGARTVRPHLWAITRPNPATNVQMTSSRARTCRCAVDKLGLKIEPNLGWVETVAPARPSALIGGLPPDGRAVSERRGATPMAMCTRDRKRRNPAGPGRSRGTKRACPSGSYRPPGSARVRGSPLRRSNPTRAHPPRRLGLIVQGQLSSRARAGGRDTGSYSRPPFPTPCPGSKDDRGVSCPAHAHRCR
jgi:hypothetical protein